MSAKPRVAHSNKSILFVGFQTEQRTLSRCFERSSLDAQSQQPLTRVSCCEHAWHHYVQSRAKD